MKCVIHYLPQQNHCELDQLLQDQKIHTWDLQLLHQLKNTTLESISAITGLKSSVSVWHAKVWFNTALSLFSSEIYLTFHSSFALNNPRTALTSLPFASHTARVTAADLTLSHTSIACRRYAATDYSSNIGEHLSHHKTQIIQDIRVFQCYAVNVLVSRLLKPLVVKCTAKRQKAV